MYSSLTNSAVALVGLGVVVAPVSAGWHAGKRVSGQIRAQFSNGTEAGCMNSDFGLMTDDAACDTFTALERPPYSDEGNGRQYRLSNSLGWGCGWKDKTDQHLYQCTETSKSGGWRQQHLAEPKDGGFIRGGGWAFTEPEACEVVPVRWGQLGDFVNVYLNLYWTNTNNTQASPPPTATRVEAASCPTTTTATPIRTFTPPPEPTNIPFRYDTWGQLHVYQGEEQKGCLDIHGAWTLNNDACGRFRIYSRTSTHVHIVTRNNYAWCINKDYETHYFSCDGDDLEPPLSYQGWYMTNPKENSTTWHGIGMPQGINGTTHIAMTQGNVDVQVKWWQEPS